MRHLLVVLAVLVLSIAVAPLAHAAVTNVVPSDGAQEPIIGGTIPDNEELWAYVTSATGGVVCVHPYTENPVSCDSKGTWAKVPIGPFTANFVPIAAGKLPPGRWIMLGAEASGEPITAESAEFTVEPCAACPAEAYTKSNEFTVQAAKMLGAIKTVCQSLAVASLLYNAREVYAVAWVSFAGGYGTGASWASTIATTAAGTGKAAFKAAGAATSALPGPFGAISKGICLAIGGIPFVDKTSAAHWAERWAADPPDPNFTVLEPSDELDFSQMTGVPADGLTDERAEMDRLRAYGRASLIAFERFQGADAAGAAAYEHAQSRVLSDHLFGYAAEMKNVADFLGETAAATRSELPGSEDRTIPQADIDVANGFADRLRADGYLPEEVAELKAIGVNDDGIARLRADQVQTDPGGLTGPAVVDGTLDELAVDMLAHAQGAEDFAREAAVYAGRSNQPSAAGFTVSTGGTGQLTATFTDTSSSPDHDPLQVEWDFGDGTTTTSAGGGSVQHTYADPGTYVVTQTVRDGYSADVKSQEVAAGPVAPPPPPPPPPAASAPNTQEDSVNVQGAAVVDVLANDEDADLDEIEVTGVIAAPEHGSAACKPRGACMYTAAGGYTGSDSFTYGVRDATGRTNTGTVRLTVVAGEIATDPVAADDTLQTRIDTPATLNVLTNDQGTGLSLASQTDPPHGSVTCTAAGSCTYTPDPGYSGNDGFRYTLGNAPETEPSKADVLISVSPSTAALGATVAGAPDPVASGASATWSAGVTTRPEGISFSEMASDAAPEISVETAGDHALEPGSVRAAPGWTVSANTARAGAGALLGEAESQAISRPLPPTSQGSGGDGHVPILVGSRVYAFFHHTYPTQVTCIDLGTGTRCPGYPITVNVGATNIIGPGAVVGSRIYVHGLPAGGYAQTAPVSLFCWDTATARPCGLLIADRFRQTYNPGGSAPVLVAGKMWFATDRGRLYCLDPSTHAPCATPFLPTGLDPADSGNYDIVSHGSRIFVARENDKVTCVDVATASSCAGWALPKSPTISAGWNLVNRYSPAGVADGVCVVLDSAECFPDANPSAASIHANWPQVENYNSVTAEAETGTRTLVGSLARGGLGCWDWVVMAPCTGGGYDAGGWLTTAGDGTGLPSAYGAAWNGACAIGLGDPGLLFTVDPRGSAPCTGIAGATTRTVDLREQRCDGGLGTTAWRRVELRDVAPGELLSAVVTVRDAQTGVIVATQDLVTGPLDLAGIDPSARPALRLEASITSAAGGPAWTDGMPPRIRLSWRADPKQLCFKTTTVARCSGPFEPISVTSRVGPAIETRRLSLTRPASCVDPTPVPTPTPTPAPERPENATQLLLGCTDRRVVLEDVFQEGRRVRLIGVAREALVGQKVEIVFAATSKVVARTVVGPDGSFAALAPLPGARLRNSNRARYLARVGTEKSLNLKLARRMIVTRIGAAGGKVTIAGRVVKPLAARAKDRAITLQRIIACKQSEDVTTFRPRASGAFAVTVEAPAGQGAAVYRLVTRVRPSARSKSSTRTFSLPRAVDF